MNDIEIPHGMTLAELLLDPISMDRATMGGAAYRKDVDRVANSRVKPLAKYRNESFRLDGSEDRLQTIPRTHKARDEA